MYSLQKIINKTSESLLPYAEHLFKALFELFFRYCERLGYFKESPTHEEQDDNDHDDQNVEQNASNTCLGSIRALLNASLPQKFFDAVAGDIYKLVSFALSEKKYDFLEEGLNVLNLYLFKSQRVHPEFVKLFPLLCYMISGVPQEVFKANFQGDEVYVKMVRNITEGADKTIVENVIGSMRNFIAKTGVDFFTLTDVAGATFLSRVFEAVGAIKGEGSYANAGYVSTLLNTLVENNLGAIDDVVASIVAFVVKEITSEDVSAKVLAVHLQVIFTCFYYDPQLTLGALNQHGAAEFIFKGIVSNPQLFRSEFEKKRVVVGNLRLLQLDQNALAASSIAAYIPELAKMTVELALRAVEQREKDQDSEQSECEDDHTHQQPLKHTQPETMEAEDSDCEWAEEYNKLYESPIDSLNETALLANFLLNEGGNYLQFVPVEYQTSLGQAMQKQNS